MRENIKLLWIVVAIGLITAITIAYFMYQYRREAWSEVARSTFAEALKAEVQKRSGNDVYYASVGYTNLSPEKEYPEDVTVMSEHGEIKYLIPFYKRKHNIENNPDNRGIQSCLLEEKPLEAGSLNKVWTGLLQRNSFPGKSMVRISVSDYLENKSRIYSGDSAYISTADSLNSYYIGLRYEVEATSFWVLPWWSLFSVVDILLLCGIVVVSFLSYFGFDYLEKLYRTYIVKTKVVTLEKQIPVITTNKSESHIYQLDAGVLFDYDSRKLRKGDKSKSLPPQEADLLKLFLDADDYMLTCVEIATFFWPKTIDPKNNLYSLVKKTKKSLSPISRCTIDNKKSTYQLKIPHSIEENG